MPKKLNLNDIINCCESRFNRGLAADWKNSDFIDLSRDILRDTGVNISTSTLKRIFGKVAVDDDYLPQQATLNALVKYGRYVIDINDTCDNEKVLTSTKPVIAKTLPRTYKYLPLIVFFAIASILAFKFLKPGNNSVCKISQTGSEGLLPSTVFFELQSPDTKDSLFLNFGDKSALVFVTNNLQKTAHNYLFPGVFDVHLQTRQAKLASTKVYVRSNKWIGFAFHDLVDVRNSRYEFAAAKTGNDSLFNVSNSQLYNAGLDTTERTYVRLCNYTPTGYSTDDFVFETTFKNKFQKGAIHCQSTQFQISGSNSMIRFKLTSAGCSFWVLNVVSEQVFEGSKTNLSQFTFNSEQWNTVKLTNRNKHLSLLVNGKQIFNGSYQKDLGEIKGVFLEFEGNGFVKNCDLKSLNGKQLYHF
jgi:hypothetical protein